MSMSCKPDQWATDWLLKQREEGKTGLTIEKRGNSHIVKWATTVWDNEQKKRHKISRYLGVLSPDGIVSKPNSKNETVVESIKDSGNAKVMAEEIKSVLGALKEHFPDDYQELVELSFARCMQRGELNKAGECWKLLENVLHLRPNTSPKSLSNALYHAGSNEMSQRLFFNATSLHEPEIAIDMSVFFSRSKGAFITRRGYNPCHSSATQVNLLMACGMASGLPQYIKVLPGGSKENTNAMILDAFEIPEGTTLVMDRGYCSKKMLSLITERKLNYVVAAKRNCKAYNVVKIKQESFLWNESVVCYGKEPFEGAFAYRFENLTQRENELKDALIAKSKGKNREPDYEKAGNFIILSTLDIEPEKIYEMYKKRCVIEQIFDTAKNCLTGDKIYMHDDRHIYGHMFVTFLASIIWIGIDSKIKKAGLGGKISVEDVLYKYAMAKSLKSADGMPVIQAIPKDLRELDKKLGYNFYDE